MKRLVLLALATCLWVAEASAQIVIDGTVDAAYGPALSVQDTRTGFGDGPTIKNPDPIITGDNLGGPNGGSEIDQVFATVADGKLYVTVNSDEEGICEVFAQMGKTGGCASSQIEAAGRLVSLALRSGIKPEAIVKQLVGIRCPSPTWQNGKMVLSCSDAMAQVLKNLTHTEFEEPTSMMGVCPECGSVMTHEEGCLNCHACGFSKCN